MNIFMKIISSLVDVLSVIAGLYIIYAVYLFRNTMKTLKKEVREERKQNEERREKGEKVNRIYVTEIKLAKAIENEDFKEAERLKTLIKTLKNSQNNG